MSKKQQLLLCQFFQELAESQKSQDRIKQQLSSNKQLDISKLFSTISNNQKSITPKLLHSYLQTKLRVNENEMYVIFSKFDHQLEGVISLNSFRRELNPLKKSKRSQMRNNDPIMLFLKLIQEWIDKERLLNVCRRELEEIIRYEMFDVIATQKKGYISRRELERFLENNQINFKDNFIDYLIFGLKRRSYFKITLEAFCQNLSPLEFGYYSTYKQSIENEGKKEITKKNEEQQKRIRQMREHQQKIQNQSRKQRRRQQAESEKQRLIEEELKREAEKAREESERLLRKAVLEAEKLERLEIEKQKLMLQDQIRQNELEKMRLEEMKILHRQQISEGRYLNERILGNDIELSERKRHIAQEQAKLLEIDTANDIHRENIQVALRRDRCLSDIYSAQRINYLQRDAELQRIRRQTSLALAQRQHQPPLYLNLDHPIQKTHIYRPQSSYTSPYVNINPISSSYGNSLNSTSKLGNSKYQKHHSLMKDAYSPIRNIEQKSRVERLRTPGEVRTHQLEKSREDLDLKKRRLEDEIRTATGRKHPYI